MRLWFAATALATSSLAAGCQTDAPAKSPDATSDSATPASEAPLTTEAPLAEGPSATSPSEPPVAPPSPPEHPAAVEPELEGSAAGDTGASNTAFIFNRVILKLASEKFAENAPLIAFLEQKTGMKVATIGRGPLAVVLVTFEATTPPRDEAAQASLIAALSGLPEFGYAEPDRLRQPR